MVIFDLPYFEGTIQIPLTCVADPGYEPLRAVLLVDPIGFEVQSSALSLSGRHLDLGIVANRDAPVEKRYFLATAGAQLYLNRDSYEVAINHPILKHFAFDTTDGA